MWLDNYTVNMRGKGGLGEGPGGRRQFHHRVKTFGQEHFEHLIKSNITVANILKRCSSI